MDREARLCAALATCQGGFSTEAVLPTGGRLPQVHTQYLRDGYVGYNHGHSTGSERPGGGCLRGLIDK